MAWDPRREERREAHFWAVYRAGQLNGFVAGWDKTGSAVEEQSGSGRLLGTLTGTLATTGAFAGQIDGNAQVAPPANIQGGGCGHHSSKH